MQQTFKPTDYNNYFCKKQLVNNTQMNRIKEVLDKRGIKPFEDCFGTSEEKQLIKYMEVLYPKLTQKYDDVYLVRNEREIKLYDFDEGRGFEPDFILFMRQKNDSNRFDNMQIFIEPKGAHLREHDEWKEKFMLRMKTESRIAFSTQTADFKIWGMPFFTYQDKQLFDRAMREEFGVQGV